MSTYYYIETLPKCGYKSREAVQLKSNTLISAKREATRKQLFKNTILFIGTEINSDGFLINAIALKENNTWSSL